MRSSAALCSVLAALCSIAHAEVTRPAVSPPTQRPIISAAGREALLREAHANLLRDDGQAAWHSMAGERLLKQMLQQLESVEDEVPSRGGARGGAEVDLEGIWLLCRTQLGAIEAALLELDGAALRVARVRTQWQRLTGGSPSMTLNYAVRAVVEDAAHGACDLAQRAGHAFDAPAEQGDGGGGGGGARGGAATRGARQAEEPPHPVEAARGGLGQARTRLGLGARRRALLRCERSLASHAGALHDLRVALRELGGEWLELGRWIGGPPLASMPWDVRPGPEQSRALLAACSRASVQLRETADAVARLGPYNLYREAAPHERDAASRLRGAARRDARPLLGATRGELVGATRDALGSLDTLRRAVSRGSAPRELSPPNVFERHSIVWLLLAAAVAYARAAGLHVHLPALRDELLRLVRAGAADFRRFFLTHVSEPVDGGHFHVVIRRVLLTTAGTFSHSCTRSSRSSSTGRRTPSTRSRSSTRASRSRACCRTSSPTCTPRAPQAATARPRVSSGRWRRRRAARWRR
jgi:hypothetical protein